MPDTLPKINEGPSYLKYLKNNGGPDDNLAVLIGHIYELRLAKNQTAHVELTSNLKHVGSEIALVVYNEALEQVIEKGNYPHGRNLEAFELKNSSDNYQSFYFSGWHKKFMSAGQPWAQSDCMVKENNLYTLVCFENISSDYENEGDFNDLELRIYVN